MFEKDDCVNVDATSSTKTALSYADKLALMAGSVSAVSLLPVAAAQAAIMHTSGSPVNVTLPSGNGFNSSDWDIDGDGNSDFFLGASNSTGGSYGYYGFALMGLIGSGGNNIAGQFGNPLVANSSVRVGSSLAFQGTGFIFSNIVGSSSTYAVLGNWNSFTPANGAFFGFRFANANLGNAINYGWARAIFDLTGARPSFTIAEWAYEDDGSSIHVPDTSSAEAVPTPSLALGILSMGAASIRRWRKQKRELQAAVDQQAA